MRNAIALSLLVVAFGCGEPSEPAPGSGPPTSCGVTAASQTPLKLQGGTRASLDSKPHGVGVSPSGVAYVTQLDKHAVSKARLPGFTFGTGIPVGNTPLRVAFNSSGTRAFVTTYSSSVQVLDVASNQVIQSIGVNGRAYAVLVAPGDSVLWVTSNVDSVYGIQIATGAVRHRLLIGARVTGLELPTGLAICDSLLYVGSGPVLVEFDTRRDLLRTGLLVGGNSQTIVIDPNKRFVYIANRDGHLQVVDVVDHRGLNIPLSGAGFGLAQSPADGRLYVTTETGNVLAIDPTTYAKVDSFFVGGTVRDIAFNGDGSIAVVANENGWVDYLTASGAVTPPPPSRTVLPGVPHGAAISPSGVVYITLLDTNRLAAGVLPSFAFPSLITVGTNPTDVVFNSTGSRAYVANQFASSSTGSVSAIDVAAGREITRFPLHSRPLAVIIAPGDSVLWVSSRDSLYGIATGTGAITHSVALGYDVPNGAIGLALRDSLLYVTLNRNGAVLEVNTRSDRVQQTFAVGGTPAGVVRAPTGDMLFIANENGRLQFWDVARNMDLGSVSLAGPGFGIARHPVTGRLYVADLAGQVEVFDPVSRARVDAFAVGGIARRVAISVDGSVVVVTNELGWVDFLQH